MNNKTAGVYQIRNKVSGSLYVGSSVNIPNRWRAHLAALRNGKKPPPKLMQAWDKYGEDAFEFSILETCEPEHAVAREQHYIDALHPKYNTRPEAKSNYGIKWSDETNLKKGRVRYTYTVNGVTGSLRELTSHFGIVNEVCARHRIARGSTPEQAVLTPGATHSERGRRGAATNKTKPFAPFSRVETVCGVTGSIKSLTDHFGVVEYGAALVRLRRGWTVEKAVTTPTTTPSERNISRGTTHPCAVVLTVAGVTGNIKELATHFGLTVCAVNARRQRGWDNDKVFLTPMKGSK